jgi:mono/diheme cytochrome c family protein
MRASLATLCVSVALIVGSAAASQSRGGGATTRRFDYSEIEKAPAKARAKQNPLEPDIQAVVAGKNLFAQHCAECHGDGGQGGKKAPSLRVSEIQGAQPGAIFWILTNGVVRKGMPVWSKLPEPQRWQLVSYIRSLGVANQESENHQLPH